MSGKTEKQRVQSVAPPGGAFTPGTDTTCPIDRFCETVTVPEDGQGGRQGSRIPDLDELLSAAIAALEDDFHSLTTLGHRSTGSPERLLRRLLDRIYESCESVLPYDRMSLALVTDDRERVSAVWVRTGNDQCSLGPGYSTRLSRSSLRTLFDARQPRSIPDLAAYAEANPGSQSARVLVGDGMRSSLTFPLFVGDKPVGFLFFTSRKTCTYNQEHIDSFQRVAERVSYAIEKCRLFCEMLSLDTTAGTAAPETDGVLRGVHSTRQMESPEVLCIETDDIARELCTVLLGEEGYAVTSTDGGNLRETIAQTSPDLVLLGLHEGSCTGACLCSYVRSLVPDRDLPILAVLPDKASPDVHCGECRAADGYMLRPVRPAELRLRVAEALQRRDARPGVGAMPVEGQLFSGRYRVAGAVGKGTNSVVYRAFDASQGVQIPVALKVQSLPPGQTTQDRFMQLFLREAYQHSQLDHPNVAKLLDFGHFGGAYFLATEFVEGLTLAEIVERHGPMDEGQLIPAARQIAEALHYFANNRVVHRDIKAQNIMLTSEGQVKVLDFGLTVSPDAQGSISGRFSGTPMYASPECISAKAPPDVRSDVYSFGVALYYLATGRYPFHAESPDALLDKHLHETPQPLSAIRSEISPPLARLVDRMLAKRPRLRPRPSTLVARLRAM